MIPMRTRIFANLALILPGAVSELALGAEVVAPRLAKPTFAVADAKPVDESGDVGAQAMPADVTDLGADTQIIGRDLYRSRHQSCWAS
jgi:hypothetical protein